MKKLITAIAALLIILLSFSGCSNSAEKTFSAKGMSITLDENFSSEELDSADLCYRSNSNLIVIEKYSFEDLTSDEFNADSSLQDFADIMAIYLGVDSDAQFKQDETGKFMYSEYTRFVQDGDYTFVPCIYKSNDAFWLFDFCAPRLYIERDDIMKWARSVVFD